MASTQCVVHHLAHFHDAARVGTIFSIHLDPKDNRIVGKPCGVLRTADFGIVGGGNAVAGRIGCVKGAVINQNATPRHQTPVNVAFDKDALPARHKLGENRALGLKVTRVCRNIPCNQMIRDLAPTLR